MDIVAIFVDFMAADVILALFTGVIVGIVIGVLPGLSATMCIALLIPVTFGMRPVAALVMLMSSYTASVYGGSITSILLHTPGTPSSAATADDGYAMTLKGQGYKAIGVSTISSAIGGFISGLALLLISPPLAQISLKFGPAEYFLVALFGLSVIAGLSGESIEKGLLAGSFGLFFSTIGLDTIIGMRRFTFGSIYLENGLSTIPAVIGMLSLSQVLIITEDIFRGGLAIVDTSKVTLSGTWRPTLPELRLILPHIARSSIIGVLIGILPGVGGDIGSFVAYKESKRWAKKPELYGNGSIEGISSSEASNNAVTGGAMIPLLTLGIPGSATAAVLLGGLMIHGLQPGYDLFSNSAHITYPIILGFILSNLLMAPLGLMLAKRASKIVLVPMAVLCPIILALSCAGSFSANNRLFDVYTLIFFGILGYVMRKTGFPVAPVILGLILGNMVEVNFRRSLVLARGGSVLMYYLSRPISCILMILLVIGIAVPCYFRAREAIRRKKGAVLFMEDEPSEDL